MFNIGLKKELKNHKKLSNFCSENMGDFLSNIIIVKDEIFEFEFSKKTSNFTVEIKIELKRDFGILDKHISVGTPKIFVNCKVYNDFIKDSFFYSEIPDKFCSLFFKYLNKNKCYKEFYHYSNIISKWNILDSEFKSNDVNYKKRCIHNIISPHEINLNACNFKLIPALVKYNFKEPDSYLKRYDFCLVLFYLEKDFLSNDELEDGNHLIPRNIILKYNNGKQIKERFISLENRRHENEEIIIDYFQSTQFHKLDIYNDILKDGLASIYIEYYLTINCKTSYFKFHSSAINSIIELWATYLELMKNSEEFQSREKINLL